jgi:DsbC/DsbD-like thiol-disulfide interchange protein
VPHACARHHFVVTRPMRISYRNFRFSILNLRSAFGAFCLLASTSLLAQAAPIPHGTIDLLAENSSIAPGHDFILGLHFKLEPGWHIYWVNPGDSGEPPKITWQLPAGLAAGELQWPAPHKMGTSTIVDYGYDGEVLLLIPVHASANVAVQQPAKLDASVRFLICREMCIPGKAQLSLTLPVNSAALSAPNSAVEPLFAAARARLPRRSPASWKYSVQDGKDSFRLDINAGQRIPSAYFFPLEESQIDNAAPQQPIPDATGVRLTLHKSDELTKPISRLKGVLVLQSGEAYVVDAPVKSLSGK